MRKVIALVMSLGLVVFTAALPVVAVPSDEVIKTNCQSAQSVLNQQEKVDAALRINRGRVYNEVIELFYAMNSRLAGNRIAAAGLATITADFDSELEHFRSDYNDYDDVMNALVTMDCRAKPNDFYTNLTEVRDQRTNLDDRIKRLDDLTKDYQDEFNDNIKGLIDAQ